MTRDKFRQRKHAQIARNSNQKFQNLKNQNFQNKKKYFKCSNFFLKKLRKITPKNFARQIPPNKANCGQNSNKNFKNPI